MRPGVPDRGGAARSNSAVRGVALFAALVAAATVPQGPPGIGIPIVAVLVVATAFLGGRPSLDFVLFGALSLVLAGSAALLDAGWVVAIDLAASVLLATMAVGGANVMAPIAPIVGLRLFPQLAPRPGGWLSPALRGGGVASVLVVTFGALFWSGDAAFAALGRSAPAPALDSLPGQLATFSLVLVGSLALAVAGTFRLERESVSVPRRPFLEWVVPLVALDVLFLAFVSVQARAMIGGHGYVRRTTGLTYAEYARAGFWQLLAAAALTLAVIAAAIVFARVESRVERRTLHGLLGLLCALTILTVASALHRLVLYEEAFGLTRLRLVAEVLALWLGSLFVLALLAGASSRIRGQLARIVTTATAVGLIAFTAVGPDRMIADRNIARWRTTGRLDVAYLQTLSADAAPALATLPEPLRVQALARVAERLGRPEPWGSFNLSRRHARSVVGRLGGTP